MSPRRRSRNDLNKISFFQTNIRRRLDTVEADAESIIRGEGIDLPPPGTPQRAKELRKWSTSWDYIFPSAGLTSRIHDDAPKEFAFFGAEELWAISRAANRLVATALIRRQLEICTRESLLAALNNAVSELEIMSLSDGLRGQRILVSTSAAGLERASRRKSKTTIRDAIIRRKAQEMRAKNPHASSADCDQLFRGIVIAESGDCDHSSERSDG
jgi:hypothetical protein